MAFMVKAAEEAGKKFGDYGAKLIESFYKKFNDVGIECDIDYRIPFETYLSRIEERYGRVKTLIYDRVPMELYSFYECVGLKCGKNWIDTDDINNVLNISNNIIITGTGGIGKTTMLRHFLLNTPKVTNDIPVMLELRSLNDMDLSETDLEKVIFDILKNNGLEFKYKHFVYSLKTGCYVFLLDGFDEVKSAYSKRVSTMIREFSEKYPLNHFIVTSRPSAEFMGWGNYTEMQPLSLNKVQAKSLIERLQKDEALKSRFINELDKDLYKKHRSFIENPLLLTIMFMTYETNAKIPETLNDFYERAFMTLFDRHDAIKDGFVREMCTGLGYEDFKRVFSHFCFLTYFKEVFDFTDVSLNEYIARSKKKYPEFKFTTYDMIADLTQNVCMLKRDGLSYSFIHRSFQEYFAALYVRGLTDEQQKKVLRDKLNDTNFNDGFWRLLHDMEKDRFNRNLFLPEFSDSIENVSDSFGIELFKKVLFGIEVVATANGYNLYNRWRGDSISLYLLNYSLNYNYSIMNIANKKRCLRSPKGYDIDAIIEHILKEKYGNISHVGKYSFDFDELERMLPENEMFAIMNGARFCEEAFIAALDLYNRYQNQKPMSGKLKDYIDDL